MMKMKCGVEEGKGKVFPDIILVVSMLATEG